MKKTTLLSLLAPIALALMSGCATTVEAPKAPRTATVDEDVFVLPAGDMAPPGSMDVSWQPAAPPPEQEVKARKLVAKPHLVSNKHNRGRLFVLPTSVSH